MVVLGSTGMLGSEVARVAKNEGLDVVEVSRKSNVKFDFLETKFEDIATELELSSDDLLVNCIGWIPQKASGNFELDSRLATLLNTTLLEEIADSQKKHAFSWMQIETDCAFKGDRGSYSEKDEKDGDDLYGKTKIAGERFSAGAIQIRCSLVGRDELTNSGLYSWFKSAIKRGPVKGFTNHHWNGVSTTAFARLAVALANENFTTPINHHWIPKDQVSKKELLELFARYLDFESSEILSTEHDRFVDRTLTTLDQEINEDLWRIAGYQSTPSINELCKEFIEIDQQLDSQRD